MKKVLVLNGPNLNMLGTREPGIYGTLSLSEIETEVAELGAELNIDIEFRQTNSESELIHWLQGAAGFAGVVINPAAFTHYSIALRDAVALVRDRGVKVVECHLSNPAARESFRHESLISGVATGVISGFGAQSYLLALRAVVS